MDKKRPVGVSVIGIVMFVFSIFFLWKCFDLRGSAQIFSIVMAIACPIAAYGVFTLKRWARIFTLSIAALIVIGVGGGLISSHFTDDSEARALIGLAWVLASPFIIFGVSCIYYLTRPKIKEHFNKA